MQKLKNLPLKWSVTIALFIATLFMAVFATAYKLPQIYKYEKDIAGRNTSRSGAEFLEKSVLTTEEESPYLETGIPGYFFTADFDGDISFYRITSGQLKKVRSSFSEKVTLPGTKNEITVSFLTVNENTVGFGVFSNKKAKETPYAFVMATVNNITENYDYVAYVDYTVSDYYSNDKSYETAFVFSKNHSDTEVIFELDPKTSFIALNLIDARRDGFYFFKKNAESEGYGLYLKTTVSGKEVTISENIALPHAFVREGDLLLLEYADIYRNDMTLQTATQFILTQVTGITTDYRREFQYNPEEYFIRGNYILSPQEKMLYDVIGDTVQAIRTELSLDAITGFALSDGGAKIAITGHSGTDSDRIIFYEFATNKTANVSGKGILMPDNANLTFVGDEYISFMSPASNSSCVRNIFIPWTEVIN